MIRSIPKTWNYDTNLKWFIKKNKMKKFLIILIVIIHSFSAISQANDEEQNIYNTVLNYYFSKYHNDTTKTILIIDTTKTLKDERLNTIIEITRKIQDGNYCSYYHDYLDVDTYFSFAHGSMAGMSMILILSKDLNVWTVKKIISIAIS